MQIKKLAISTLAILSRLKHWFAQQKKAVYALCGPEYQSRSSYSQFGEDMILRAVFARYPDDYAGIYVDVGSYHPMRFSNTRYFYEQGWRGICIDPNPKSRRLFEKWRMKDVFVQVAVTEEEATKTYYMYDSSPSNTLLEMKAKEAAEKIRGTIEVQGMPLRRILAQNLPAISEGQPIDFLSIDVEGLDVEALKSNDWTLYRPRIVVIEEVQALTLAEMADLESVSYMQQQAYRPFARTPSALFFIDTKANVYDGGNYLQYKPARP